MQLVYSGQAKPIGVKQDVLSALQVDQDWLRRVVQQIAIPRHFIHQSENNRIVGDWLDEQFRAYGFSTRFQGEHRNLMTLPSDPRRPIVLVGAHYDSVSETPGADDNASAVAAMLACARAVAKYDLSAPLCFVAFNREEEKLTGSRDFVSNFLASSPWQVSVAHVLEMVGFRDRRRNSQRLPRGLPIRVSDTGDFLGIIGNSRSKKFVDRLMCCAKTYTPELPVIGLKIFFGLEKRIRHFVRSDHAPFWEAKIPALMWTDTAEFRNPNYHQPSDTPDTLDYDFLKQTAQLLTAQVLTAIS